MNILGFYRGVELYLSIYLILINMVSFGLMGIDKYKSRKNTWRIRERTFFLLSLFGGAIGNILGMVVFRHKTQHKSFYLGMPLLYFFNKVLLEIIRLKIG